MIFFELADQRRQEGDRWGMGTADHEGFPPRRRRGRLESTGKFFELCQDLFNVNLYRASFASQLNRSANLAIEFDAQPCFERLHLLKNRRLADSQRRRCFGDARLSANRVEDS